jgi:MinD-like ATPase involved in chromosome partitioning or flagellar assembly
MVTSVFRVHPLRRMLRLKSLAAIPILAALGSTSPAAANEFTINACMADRANYSTQAFDDFATRGMLSPKGGVGKTTITFLVANILASHLKLRAIAVDVNPGNGTLGRLTAESDRPDTSVADLLDDADHLATAAELRCYVARLPSGLHLLAAPHDARAATLGPDRYGEVVALLSCFYETIVLDLGTGMTGPLARFGIDRADQFVLVTTPDKLTATLAVHALGHLDSDRATVVVNGAHPRLAPELTAIEECLLRRKLNRPIAIPADRRLAAMLDTGAYSLEALDRHTRLPVKRLGLAVAERLV